jgi:hypothetical protein
MLVCHDDRGIGLIKLTLYYINFVTVIYVTCSTVPELCVVD